MSPAAAAATRLLLLRQGLGGQQSLLLLPRRCLTTKDNDRCNLQPLPHELTFAKFEQLRLCNHRKGPDRTEHSRTELDRAKQQKRTLHCVA